jgi:uncharacterized protein YdbL (DUF1318 family)
MMSKRALIALAAAAAGVAAVAAAPAIANATASVAMRQEARAVVNAAKAEGIVGEMADGYVGVRLEAQMTPAIRAAMAEMNAGRAELYRQAAQAAGTDTAAAGASSFQQRFSSIPAGQWYGDASGTWRQK